MIFASKSLNRLLAVLILAIGSWKLGDHGIKWITWEEVPATITEVAVSEEPRESGTVYKVSVGYRFTIDGKEFSSWQLDFFGRDSILISDPSEAEIEADKYRLNPPQTCRVHPANHSRSAILPLMELDVSIAVFCIGLLWMILMFWEPFVNFLRRGRQPTRPNFLDDVVPITGVGLLLTVSIAALLIAQRLEEKQAQTWTETPAVVLQSELIFEDSEWKPIILYEWVGSDGEKHRSSLVTFAAFYGPVTALEPFMERYREGAEIECFVNPQQPRQAVLVREYRLANTGMFALAMLAMVTWIFVFRSWRAWWRSVPPQEFDLLKLLRPAAPLVVAAWVFLIEAAAPVIREWQLGAFWSMTQVVAAGSLVVVVGSILVPVSHWLIRRAEERNGR